MQTLLQTVTFRDECYTITISISSSNGRPPPMESQTPPVESQTPLQWKMTLPWKLAIDPHSGKWHKRIRSKQRNTQ